MPDTIPFITGSGIERDGVRFHLDMAAMGRIQMNIPVETNERAFIEFSQVLRYCGTPAGIPVMLAEACELKQAEVVARFAATEQMSIAGELINTFLGIEPGDESEQEQAKPNADPTQAPQPTQAASGG